MKKSPAKKELKLRLSRETLRSLTPPALAAAIGAVINGTSRATQCGNSRCIC